MVTAPVHVLSIDVEHWYDGNLNRPLTYRPGAHDPRLLSETARLLDILAERAVKATFFILGGVAEESPTLVRRIAAAGHEIGSHSWSHELVRDLTPKRYLAGLRRSRSLLQHLSSQPVLGQRAPSWSIDRRVPWALDALVQAGFTYDSSVFPLRTPLYGVRCFPTRPCWLNAPSGGRLLEWPPAVWRRGPLAFPFGGGLYWRILPQSLIRHLLRTAPAPVVTYIHPWELNAAPLALPAGVGLMHRFALRWGVRGGARRLRALLAHQSFEPFRTAIERLDTASLPTVRLPGD